MLKDIGAAPVDDLTIIYYSANRLPAQFAEAVREHLKHTAHALRIPIISVTQEPVTLGRNVVVARREPSIWMLYLQVLVGAQLAKTPYLMMCEDDCLYSTGHFVSCRPRYGVDFLFNLNRWSLRTWDKKPCYSHKERSVFSQMLAQRKSLIRALKERLSLRGQLIEAKRAQFIMQRMGEPGRYDAALGITQRTVNTAYWGGGNVVFDHLYGLQARDLAKRKKMGPVRTDYLQSWGDAGELLVKYWGEEELQKQRT